MRPFIFQGVAGILLLVGAGLIAAASLPARAASPPKESDEFVAYIGHFVPPNAKLADITSIKRDNRELSIVGDSVSLMPGDQIFMKRQDAVLTVRMLASNRLILVRKGTQVSDTGAADLVIEPPPLPGLHGGLLAWFTGVLRGADQTGDGSVMAASRAVNTGPCYNETGKTNEPVTFRIPILAATRSVLAAGNRAIFVSWQGGAPPFSVTLSAAETGKLLAQTVGVRGTCAAYLPRTDLRPGQYRLTLTDGQNVKEQEDSLFVVAEAPAEPRELRDANLPEEARQIYAATWLAVLDRGTWAFEAQQRVAGMDCRSAAVEDWLRQWGSSTPCADAKR
jgi:hypothetical protein